VVKIVFVAKSFCAQNYSALKGHFIKAQGSALGTSFCTQNYSALKGRFIKAQGSALGTSNNNEQALSVRAEHLGRCPS